MENSNIEWTDHTFNPWVGCTKVSDGCKHCYAETLMDKRYGKVKWGPQGQRIRTSPTYWKQPFKWNREAKAAGVRRRVFCGSLCDVFEDKADQENELWVWRIDLIELIEATPQLDWLLLTKRPENIMRMMPAAYRIYDWDRLARNIWIGTSVENQEQADKRIPHLLQVPAAVRFLSVEPLLGPVDLQLGYSDTISQLTVSNREPFPERGDRIHWVIVGGESGKDARPMHPGWVRDLRNACFEAGVPFFFKQWGEWYPHYPLGTKQAERGLTWTAPWDDGQQMWRVGKKRAGRLLDGREWNELPAVEVAA